MAEALYRWDAATSQWVLVATVVRMVVDNSPPGNIRHAFPFMTSVQAQHEPMTFSGGHAMVMPATSISWEVT